MKLEIPDRALDEPPPLPAAPTNGDSPQQAEEPQTMVEAMTAERAFVESEALTFQGRTLKPFSARRQMVAGAIGCKLFTAPADDGETDPGANEARISLDAATVIWLMTQQDDKLAKWAANPNTARNLVLDFVDQHQCGIGQAGYLELFEVLAQIMQQIEASLATPEASGGGNDLGEE